jgi:hypothetical protein
MPDLVLAIKDRFKGIAGSGYMDAAKVVEDWIHTGDSENPAMRLKNKGKPVAERATGWRLDGRLGVEVA